MTASLLLAPAGHGKTEHLIQRIRRLLKDEPLASVIVVVPNAIQARGFRQRLNAAGGALGVEVHTFHTLYAELLARAGQPIPLLTDPVRIRLLRAVVDDCCARGALVHYAALHDRRGFIAALRNAIEELKRARIFPKDFSSAVEGLDARLREIAVVYSAYQDWLQKQNWADNEGRGWLTAVALESTAGLGADTRLLAVSGFDEFNPTQLTVLSLMAKRAKETIVTLTGDLARPTRSAHHRFRRAQTALTSAFEIQPEAMETSSMLSGNIAEVEAGLFELPQTCEVSETSEAYIEFVEAQTRALEVRSALRWIKARVVRDGISLGDAAILARDLEPYRSFIEETADEFGIPLRIIGGQPLAENPAIAALMSLLSLPVENWKRNSTMNALRSPYFDLRFTPEMIVTFDEISALGRVIQGLEQWREAIELWKKRKITEFEEDLPFDGSESKVQILDEALEAAFESFVDLLTPPSRASAREYAAFVESLIGDDLPTADNEGSGINLIANARENASTAARDIAALTAFKDVLRGLVLAESALGEETLDYAAFYRDLRGAVESAIFSDSMETGLFAASVMNARGLSFQAVALMGLAEGEFPKQEREDILLRESDRAALRQRGLPLETKLHGDEATLFYQAVTRARQKLLLTRPYLTEDGQAWEESPFWAEIIQLIGDPPKVRVSADSLTEPADFASPVEQREHARESDIQIKKGAEVLRARTNPIAVGKFEGEIFDVSERFGAGHGWSASRLESYGTCPFEFFIAHALELQPKEISEEGFDIRMLGSMLHKILEDHYGGMTLTDAANATFATAPEVYGFRPSALWSAQKAELTRMLEKTVRELNKISVDFKPFKMEARFGMGKPSLVLRSSIGEIRLHGYIDRVDKSKDGSLRVMDYKSGSATISAKHLQEGRRLQLPIYALAARDALGLGDVSSGFYWHITKAETSSLKLEKFDGGIEGAFETAIQHVTNHVKGIRAGHFEPKPPEDGCPSYCPAVEFCWRCKQG